MMCGSAYRTDHAFYQHFDAIFLFFFAQFSWHCASWNKSMLLVITPIFAAAGWAFLYYLLGGGLGGAFVIFIILKMIGH